MRHYFVYILTSKSNKVLYAGVTNNLERRIREHRSKFIPGFTRKYNVDKLVFFESFLNPTDAIGAEKRIKGWLRAKKIKLIESKNPNWLDLFEALESYSATGGLGIDKNRDPSPLGSFAALRMTDRRAQDDKGYYGKDF